jgi:hypothetical protein
MDGFKACVYPMPLFISEANKSKYKLVYLMITVYYKRLSGGSQDLFAGN